MRNGQLTALCFTAGVLVLTCSENADAPHAGRWETLFTIPNDYAQAFALLVDRPYFGEGGVYDLWVAARYQGTNGAILRYHDKRLEPVFISPYPSVFEDIGGYYFGLVIAVGSKETSNGREPYAVAIDNDTLEITELDLKAVPAATISGIYVCEPNEIWMTATGHNAEFYGIHAGVPVLYQAGEVRVFEWLGAVTGALSFKGVKNTFYGVEYAGDNINPKISPLGPGYKSRGKIFITSDDGHSWVIELLPRFINGREVHSAMALTTRRPYGDLFLKIKFKDGANGIVRRSGPPGAPVFDLVFLSFAGPYFLDVKALAFAENEGGGLSDGVAVGNRTTIINSEGLWKQEETSYPFNYVDVEPILDIGFASLARDIMLGGWTVLYHP